ncbi:unnamed protein product [Brassica rapa]|uniref:Uncharacterized protein n=1 Tax=Brassica campestris TaxID=3711 RepID=A0A8D9I093_BRACM|nr:unnamed protein product [Brassica rapa]
MVLHDMSLNSNQQSEEQSSESLDQPWLVLFNLMLAIYEKKMNSLDHYRPLRYYIAFTYSERKPPLRYRPCQSTIHLPPPGKTFSSLITKLSAFWRHDSQSPPRNITSTSFQWYDALKQKQKGTHQNIHFEKAAVLSIPSISARSHEKINWKKTIVVYCSSLSEIKRIFWLCGIKLLQCLSMSWIITLQTGDPTHALNGKGGWRMVFR